MNKHTHGPSAQRTLLGLLLLLAFAAAAPPARAQERRIDLAVPRVQEAVRERIRGERGGRDPNVTFNDDVQRYPVSSGQVGVRGTGVYNGEGRGGRGRREQFSYDAVFNARADRVERLNYRFEVTGGIGGAGSPGGRREVPRWLVGTFRGRNPAGRTRQTMTVTVDSDGNVSAVDGDGRRERGTYEERQIRFGDGQVWNVSRNDDGFRAQHDATRRVEDFRSVSGGGDVGDGDGDGRVPRWVIGTFRGTTDSGESELTINRDGSATARSLTNNTTFLGRYGDGVLTFDWGSFNVTREPDGIRTIQVNNRNNQTSYRRIN